MPLESFYGGKQGISPIIKARFEYVTGAKDTEGNYIDAAYGRALNAGKSDAELKDQTMESCFSDPNYTDVWYGELAIINTTNKRNPNNGKLFRRTLKRTDYDTGNSTPHAEYLGTIVGPSEGFPFVNLTGSIDNLKNTVSSKNLQTGDFDFSYPAVSDGSISMVRSYTFKDTTSLGSYEATVDNQALVPGAKKENNEWGNFEKGIKYSWVTVRNNIDGIEQETYVYLGFQIPYTIFDLNFNTENWNYTGKTASFENESNYSGVKPENDSNWQSTPFYQKWSIHIPRGIPGNKIHSLRRVKANTFKNWDKDESSEKEVLYNFNKTYIDSKGDFNLPNVSFYNSDDPATSYWHYDNETIDISSSNYFGGEEIKPEADILVYTISAIDGEELKKVEFNCFLSKIKDINNITLSDEGLVTVYYNDDTFEELENKIKWIDEIVQISKTKGNNQIYGYEIKYNTNKNKPDNSDNFKLYIPYLYDMWTQIETEDGNPVWKVRYRKTDFDGDLFDSQILKTKNDKNNTEYDFSFSSLNSLKIDEKTKELIYTTSPFGHKMTKDDNWVDDTEKTWTKFGENGVYLNNIAKMVTYNGYLYVLYSSSKYRYQGEGTHENIKTPKGYTYDVATDGNGAKWRCNHIWDEIKDPLFECDEIVRGTNECLWWLELGRIEKPREGVWIVSDFNTERFVAYFREANKNINSVQQNIHEWEDFSFDDEVIAVLDILNGTLQTALDGARIDEEWTIVDKDDNIISTSPYTKGHIFIYNEDESNVLEAAPIDDKAGNLIKFDKYYFYYNYQKQEWDIAGAFGGTEDSGIQKWPIVLQQGNNVFPESKVNYLDSENTLVLVQEDFNFDDSENPYLSDLYY